jgi:hypothetical protein
MMRGERREGFGDPVVDGALMGGPEYNSELEAHDQIGGVGVAGDTENPD